MKSLSTVHGSTVTDMSQGHYQICRVY